MRRSEEEQLKRSPLKMFGTERDKERFTRQKVGTERRQDAKMVRKKREKEEFGPQKKNTPLFFFNANETQCPMAATRLILKRCP